MVHLKGFRQYQSWDLEIIKGFRSYFDSSPRRRCPRKGIFEGQPVSFVVPNPTGSTRILGKALKLLDMMPVRLEMANCPRCGRSMPHGSVACSVCGTRLQAQHGHASASSSCRACGRRLPFFDSTSRARGMCDGCQARHQRTIQIEATNELLRKAVYVREVAATQAELRPMILRTLGVQDLQRDFSVGDHHYQQICDWERCIAQAKNFESARRYEDAAKVYEELGLWKEAGTARDKKSARTVKHVTVNINDLIEKVRDGGLTIPYKCHSCGATITIDSSSNPDGLKFCSYCGSAVDPDSMLDIIKSALK